MDSKTLVTLALLDAFGAKQGLLTYFADLGGPAFWYLGSMSIWFEHRLFVGPKIRKDLMQRANNLELSIDMGWFGFWPSQWFWLWI